MKVKLTSALFAVFTFCATLVAHAAPITINPVGDGTLYVCDTCNVVHNGDYLMASGYIQGDAKFSAAVLTGPVSQALLSLNPYGEPLWGPDVAIYGYGSTDSQLDLSDANAGTYLGTLVLPQNLGYGQNVYFDVTSFINSIEGKSPYIAFNLRTASTDIFSSINYNVGHPEQLLLGAAVPEPSTLALFIAGLLAVVAVLRRRPVAFSTLAR
jgi:hypothetical protein